MLHPFCIKPQPSSRVIRSAGTSLAAWICLTSIVMATETADLIQLLPSEINALTILRVEDALQTPKAKRENWAQHADENFMNGTGGIPSWVKVHVTGFLVRPALMQEVWGASIAVVPENVTVQSIGNQQQITLEEFSGIPALRTPRNSYLLGISPGVLGIWRPAIRQEASHWARSLSAKVTGPLSVYLQQAAARPGQMVMAIDLENTLDPLSTSLHLEAMREFSSDQARREQLYALLMTLRGVTLTATTVERTTAQIRIDFQQDVGSLAGPVKAFFLSLLHDMGAAIDDFDQAPAKGDGKSVVLQTELGDESLRRLVSLVTSAPAMTSMQGSETGTPASESGASAAASAKYFKQIDNYVNDLSKASRRSNDPSRVAMWHEKYASKIEELPVAGVDPVLLDYAGDVASKLRALGRSLRGQQLDVNLQQGTLTYNYDYTPGWASMSVWGGVGYGAPSVNVTSNLQKVREEQAAAISAGAKQREEVWAILNEARGKTLRQMQQKYGDDFIK